MITEENCIEAVFEATKYVSEKLGDKVMEALEADDKSLEVFLIGMANYLCLSAAVGIKGSSASAEEVRRFLHGFLCMAADIFVQTWDDVKEEVSNEMMKK